RDDLVTGVQTCALPISAVGTEALNTLHSHEGLLRRPLSGRRRPCSPSRGGGRPARAPRFSAACRLGSGLTFSNSRQRSHRPCFRSEERRVGKGCTPRTQ